jgi:hypothetical protein
LAGEDGFGERLGSVQRELADLENPAQADDTRHTEVISPGGTFGVVREVAPPEAAGAHVWSHHI